ncbi:hypothetical protein N836_17650 [Leptolyngbya sp. Heron Island J]|uniref:hypothetical protein n=1 Tax=Leptolyngbya sp. Heron Island J TaxID=1385935 RepID=UPI0003B9DABD|nr:hypothetical protein [Leptolyngbya sp. Heron Island J]ESA34242.1 hypothetical protein N836_17650 [Leptolyngbya sp. Heron Island J]
MQQIVFMIAVILLLTTSCISADELSTSVPGPDNSGLEETVDMSEASLSSELQQAFLQAVATEQNISPADLSIVKSAEADWPDACLGLSGLDEFCAQMIVPGWSISVTDGEKTWQYRTDLDMTQIRLATSE